MLLWSYELLAIMLRLGTGRDGTTAISNLICINLKASGVRSASTVAECTAKTTVPCQQVH